MQVNDQPDKPGYAEISSNFRAVSLSCNCGIFVSIPKTVDRNDLDNNCYPTLRVTEAKKKYWCMRKKFKRCYNCSENEIDQRFFLNAGS